MIEVTILNHLKTKLSVPAHLEKPESAPSDMYYLKTGSQTTSKHPLLHFNHIQTVCMDIFAK